MKKVLSIAVALGFCLYLPAAALAGGGKQVGNDEIMRELQELRNQVSQQQAEIDMLKGQKPADTTGLSTRVDALEQKKGYVVAGNEFIDQITLKGDLRVRYEHIDRNFNGSDDKSLEQFRSRFRLGGVWDNKAENWQVGAGLATGDATNATSTNDTWGTTNPFDHSTVSLDYAYAKHKWNDYSVTLGQMENPYVTTWAMFDSDVRFTGLTMAYGQKEGVFATASAYGAQTVLYKTNNENTAMMYIGQVGYRDKFSEKGKYTLAAGYQVYDQEFINQNGLLGNVDRSQYGLDIGDLYGDVSLPVGPMNVKMYGQVWQNFGADGAVGESQEYYKIAQGTTPETYLYKTLPENPGDNDMGWVLGLETKYENFRFGYAYAHIEADSLYGYLTDADFGIDTTNKKGHKVNLGYDVTKNWAVDFIFWNTERIVDLLGDTKTDDKNTYQLDVSYKF